jgi:hypothetical protein
MKHHSGAPRLGSLLTIPLPTNVRLGWKGLPLTNSLDFYKNMKIAAVKGFIRYVPDGSIDLLTLEGIPVSGCAFRQHQPPFVKLATFLRQILLLKRKKNNIIFGQFDKKLRSCFSNITLYLTFLFCFIMHTLSMFSSINNFNKHVQIDNFHFKRETRIKEKLLN